MDLVVADVSFISVKKILPGAVECANPTADFLILIKPQFELEREEVGHGGIVRESLLHEKAIESVRHAAQSLGLNCLRVAPSKLMGQKATRSIFFTPEKS